MYVCRLDLWTDTKQQLPMRDYLLPFALIFVIYKALADLLNGYICSQCGKHFIVTPYLSDGLVCADKC